MTTYTKVNMTAAQTIERKFRTLMKASYRPDARDLDKPDFAMTRFRDAVAGRKT
jgi:hypothetical protein